MELLCEEERVPTILMNVWLIKLSNVINKRQESTTEHQRGGGFFVGYLWVRSMEAASKLVRE